MKLYGKASYGGDISGDVSKLENSIERGPNDVWLPVCACSLGRTRCDVAIVRCQLDLFENVTDRTMRWLRWGLDGMGAAVDFCDVHGWNQSGAKSFDGRSACPPPGTKVCATTAVRDVSHLDVEAVTGCISATDFATLVFSSNALDRR